MQGRILLAICQVLLLLSAVTQRSTGNVSLACKNDVVAIPEMQLFGNESTPHVDALALKTVPACQDVCVKDADCVAFMLRKSDMHCSIYHSVNGMNDSHAYDSYAVYRCTHCPHAYAVSNNTHLEGTVLVDWSNHTLLGSACLDKCNADTKCVAVSVRNSDHACITYSEYTRADRDNYTSFVLQACDTGCKAKFVPLTNMALKGEEGNHGNLTTLNACQDQCLNDPKCVAISIRNVDHVCHIYYSVASQTTSTEYSSYNLTRCLYHSGHWSAWSYSACSVTCGRGLHHLTRVCNNPAPTSGKGHDCIGAATDVATCVQQRCPHN